LTIPFRLFSLLAPNELFNYLLFQSFDYDGIWYREVQARVVCTKFEIYVFIIQLCYVPTCCRPEYACNILPLEAYQPIIHQSFQTNKQTNIIKCYTCNPNIYPDNVCLCFLLICQSIYFRTVWFSDTISIMYFYHLAQTNNCAII
jgi:hypothetical protein